MRVITFQIGARHNYAVPRMLERAGMLELLWTGPCADQGLGLWLSRLLPKYFQRGKLAALIRRKVGGVPSAKIRTCDRLVFHRVPRDADYSTKADHYSRQNNLFARAVRQVGLPAADLAYFMVGEGTPIIEFAQAQGLRIAVEFTVTPLAFRILAEERLKFPDWESSEHLDLDKIEGQFRQQLAAADYYICPSENVVRGLKSFPEFSEPKCHVVPYGSGSFQCDKTNQPVVGRILFAGTAELRKGIHYYAEAANLLRQAGQKYEFRVAGNVSQAIQSRDECKHLQFLGRLGRNEMLTELSSADVMVLPTLAEGSATVVNEALALKLPVITTPAAGSLITDGNGGLLVPERDAPSLAAAIHNVVSQRELREKLAASAYELSKHASETAWQARLIPVLQKFCE